MVLFFLSKSEDSRGSSDLVMSQSWVRYEHSRQKQNLSEGVFFGEAAPKLALGLPQANSGDGAAALQ